MTTVARRILDDCGTCLQALRDEPKGTSWRIQWVATLALLRAVGHALDKVDGGKDAKLAAIVQNHWKRLSASKPKPEIFWHFIKAERDSLLKEYETAARVNVTVRLGVVEPSKPNVYEYTMGPGPFEGHDQRELVAEAIAFWDAYLFAIEAEYAGQTP
jgi:hypothetical protein